MSGKQLTKTPDDCASADEARAMAKVYREDAARMTCEILRTHYINAAERLETAAKQMKGKR